jgi:Zn-finger protein
MGLFFFSWAFRGRAMFGNWEFALLVIPTPNTMLAFSPRRQKTEKGLLKKDPACDFLLSSDNSQGSTFCLSCVCPLEDKETSKSGTSSSTTSLCCPIEGCVWVHGSKGGRSTVRDYTNGLWHYLKHYAVKDSETPEKIALEKAHAEAHQERKDDAGKSHSHTRHTLTLSLVLTGVSIEPKTARIECQHQSIGDWRKNHSVRGPPSHER